MHQDGRNSAFVVAPKLMDAGFGGTVGTSNGLFFHVKAQGDSWEQVIGKLTEKQAA